MKALSFSIAEDRSLNTSNNKLLFINNRRINNLGFYSYEKKTYAFNSSPFFLEKNKTLSILLKDYLLFII